MLKKPDISSLDNLDEIDKERLEQVWQLITNSKIRFIVSETVKRTLFKKGHVSNILTGKIPMSLNFYDTFREKFAPPKKTKIEIKNADVGKELGKLIEISLNQQAILNVLMKVFDKLSTQEIEKEASRLYAEYLNQLKL